jgi:hypothetical protein
MSDGQFAQARKQALCARLYQKIIAGCRIEDIFRDALAEP